MDIVAAPLDGLRGRQANSVEDNPGPRFCRDNERARARPERLFGHSPEIGTFRFRFIRLAPIIRLGLFDLWKWIETGCFLSGLVDEADREGAPPKKA